MACAPQRSPPIYKTMAWVSPPPHPSPLCTAPNTPLLPSTEPGHHRRTLVRSRGFRRSYFLTVAGTLGWVKGLRGPSRSWWWRWQGESSTVRLSIAHWRSHAAADPHIAVGRALHRVIHGMNSSHVFELVPIARSTCRGGV
jgi:hypothetical protein